LDEHIHFFATEFLFLNSSLLFCADYTYLVEIVLFGQVG